MYKDILRHYDNIVATCPQFERKGKSMPYTSANGYMFSFMNKDGEFGIRFSKEVQLKYINKLESSIFKSHGAIMKGYVLIPLQLMSDYKLIAALLDESYHHVMSLPAK